MSQDIISQFTTAEPPTRNPEMPRHVAIIMDGNGRWASKRFLPRIAGHKKGIDAVRVAVEYALKQQISYLTLFAFSSENWRRPETEVSYLMGLFESVLSQEIEDICQHHVRLKVIGDLSRFSPRLQQAIRDAMNKTEHHDQMTLTIAANYGGRWDIRQAMEKMLQDKVDSTSLDDETIRPYLSLGDIPDPDLFIRTGGEQRISNFLLWHLAYTELYFSDILWPDFNHTHFEEALVFYQQRERRFGQTSEQVTSC